MLPRVSGSSAHRAEAKETLARPWFSLTLLLSVVANALAGWRWANPIAALFMTPWLAKEGIEGVPDRSNKPYCFPMALDHS
jgi:divalent metal cation (Fe/Co/Zn/Cd) transporter